MDSEPIACQWMAEFVASELIKTCRVSQSSGDWGSLFDECIKATTTAEPIGDANMHQRIELAYIARCILELGNQSRASPTATRLPGEVLEEACKRFPDCVAKNMDRTPNSAYGKCFRELKIQSVLNWVRCERTDAKKKADEVERSIKALFPSKSKDQSKEDVEARAGLVRVLAGMRKDTHDAKFIGEHPFKRLLKLFMRLLVLVSDEIPPARLLAAIATSQAAPPARLPSKKKIKKSSHVSDDDDDNNSGNDAGPAFDEENSISSNKPASSLVLPRKKLDSYVDRLGVQTEKDLGFGSKTMAAATAKIARMRRGEEEAAKKNKGAIAMVSASSEDEEEEESSSDEDLRKKVAVRKGDKKRVVSSSSSDEDSDEDYKEEEEEDVKGHAKKRRKVAEMERLKRSAGSRGMTDSTKQALNKMKETNKTLQKTGTDPLTVLLDKNGRANKKREASSSSSSSDDSDDEMVRPPKPPSPVMKVQRSVPQKKGKKKTGERLIVVDGDDDDDDDDDEEDSDGDGAADGKRVSPIESEEEETIVRGKVGGTMQSAGGAKAPNKPKRRPWTQAETKALVDGHKEFGNMWAEIRRAHFNVLQHRTPINLKDRFRNLLQKKSF